MPGFLTPAKRRLLEKLKVLGESTTNDLAAGLGLTEVAVRQHLRELTDRRYVDEGRGERAGRGRPPSLWSLTERSMELFPDRHGELTVDLLAAARGAFGAEGVERLLAVRAEQQREAYAGVIPGESSSLGERVEALSRQRTREGYMAETITEADGGFTLVEHHCPICVAAASCQGLCARELDLFRQVLGSDARVERTAHRLSDGDRCVYRIRRAEG